MDRESGQGQDPRYRPEPSPGPGAGGGLPPSNLPPGNLPPTPLPPLGPDPMPAPRQGMSSTMKILLLLGGLLAVCCIAVTVAIFAGGALLARSFNQSPQRAQEVGQSILNYRLPPGYREQGSMSLLGNQMVIITRDGREGLVIMLARLRSDFTGNEEQFRRQFEEQMSRQMGGATGRDFRQTGTQQITINGTPVTMVISEGTADTGNTSVVFRQGVAAFPLGADAGLLMIMGPISAWDSSDLNVFLESIR